MQQSYRCEMRTVTLLSLTCCFTVLGGLTRGYGPLSGAKPAVSDASISFKIYICCLRGTATCILIEILHEQLQAEPMLSMLADDGGLTNFIPLPPVEHGVRVCCFASKQITRWVLLGTGNVPDVHACRMGEMCAAACNRVAAAWSTSRSHPTILWSSSMASSRWLRGPLSLQTTRSALQSVSQIAVRH
jgi:hypothetical protein